MTEINGNAISQKRRSYDLFDSWQQGNKGRMGWKANKNGLGSRGRETSTLPTIAATLSGMRRTWLARLLASLSNQNIQQHPCKCAFWIFGASKQTSLEL